MQWLSFFCVNISLAEHKHLNSHSALIFFVRGNKTKSNDRRRDWVPEAYSLGSLLGLNTSKADPKESSD